MKSTRLFGALSTVALGLMMVGTSVVSVHSQAATPAATMAATSSAPVKYCTPDIANANQKKGYFIPVISKGFAAQFWQVVKLGVYQAAQDCGVGVDYVGPADETGLADQLDMLSNALARKPSAIVFAALDTKAALPTLQQAQAAKIPIIAFDSGVAGDIPVTTAATDNTKAAGAVADKMAELIGGEGEVAVIAHDQTSATGIGRRDGFVNEIKAKYPKITIVDIQYPAGGNVLPSDDATKAVLAAHPNLKAIFATNEGTAEGAVQAFTELKMAPGKVILIGYDSGKIQIDAIKSGLESGAITQNPYGIGYLSIEAAVKVLNGLTVDKNIDTGYFYYDKTNITDPNIALLLYQ
jgi:ribose transport system substrate-binding protein